MSVDTPESKTSAPELSSASHTNTVPLDSLFTPKTSSFETLPRASVGELDFNDVALDDDLDDPLSPVALSSQDGQETTPTLAQNDWPNTAPPFAESSDHGQSSVPSTQHRRSESNTTIRSIRNIPFMLARLDAQKSEEDSVAANRKSMDGQHKIQEEFVRLQKEKEEEDQQPVTGIDWGSLMFVRSASFLYSRCPVSTDFWGAVISGKFAASSRHHPALSYNLHCIDYQGYASQQPEALARAIEKGIPGTLRGMMWQLMYMPISFQFQTFDELTGQRLKTLN